MMLLSRRRVLFGGMALAAAGALAGCADESALAAPALTLEEQIRELSAFKATTGKLIPFMFIGLGGAFVTAMMMKRSRR